jgi:sarcosine oxidase, subunit gamma
MRDRERVQISRISNLGLVHVKSWMPGGASTPVVAPDVTAQFRLLHLAPGECLAISDVIDGSALRGQLERDAREEHVVLVDVSQGLSALRIVGAAARETLTKSCGVDLHPRAFPAGHSTRTRFARLPIIMECRDTTPRFDLYVGRSYSSYLLAWLRDSAVEYRCP